MKTRLYFHQQTAFTIIELLIIIAVIGILVTIGIATWSDFTTSSQNNVRLNELNQWSNSFDLYKTKYACYPAMPTADTVAMNYCLGDFPGTGNKCGQYTSADPTKALSANGTLPGDPAGAEAVSIRTELGKVGNVPADSAPNISGLYIGPYVSYSQQTTGGTVTVTAKLIAIFNGGSCPGGTVLEPNPAIANVTGVTSCSITKTMSYTP